MASQPKAAPNSPFFQVPLARNPHFTGRDKIINALRRGLLAAGSSPHVRVVTGNGGVGKTHLAAEYAYRHAQDYQLVCWLRAEEPAPLIAGYAGLAGPLGIAAEESSTLESLCDDVRRALDLRDDWLLIFDNARSLEDLRRFLPRKRSGHVLITSRDSQWRGAGETVCVLGLERNESLEMLARSTGLETDQSAVDLARTLGDLPLALEQAAACIREAGQSYADYLRLLEAQWAQFLSAHRMPGDYPDSVVLSYELSLRQVRASSPHAADLLNLCAFLAPDEIPLGLLACGGPFVPETLAPTLSDPSALEAAAGLLSRYNVVRFNGQALSLHRLVAELSRDRLTAQQRQTWVTAALRLAASAFEFDGDDSHTWHRCTPVLPHVLAATAVAEANEVESAATARLLDDAGQFLLKLAQFAQARPLFERALALQRLVHGPDHPCVAAVANNLGRTLTRLGQLNEAREHFETALAIDRATYGSADPHVAAVANNYGRCLHAAGEVLDARRQFEQALSVYENHYGGGHFKTASVENNLGYVKLRGEGHVAQGVEHFNRALAIAEEACGARHPSVARILVNLGTARLKQGDAAGALPLLERAVSIDRECYGNSHPDLMHDLRHLGDVLMGLRDFTRARECYKQALFIADSGVRNPRWLADCLNRLGNAREAEGDKDGANRCWDRAFEILRQQTARTGNESAVREKNAPARVVSHYALTLDEK